MDIKALLKIAEDQIGEVGGGINFDPEHYQKLVKFVAQNPTKAVPVKLDDEGHVEVVLIHAEFFRQVMGERLDTFDQEVH